jgi:hypothetical protein
MRAAPMKNQANGPRFKRSSWAPLRPEVRISTGGRCLLYLTQRTAIMTCEGRVDTALKVFVSSACFV